MSQLYSNMDYINSVFQKYQTQGCFIDLRYSEIRYNKIVYTGNNLRDMSITDGAGYLLRVIKDHCYVSIKFEDIRQLDRYLKNCVNALGSQENYLQPKNIHPIRDRIEYNNNKLCKINNQSKINILTRYVDLVKQYSSQIKCNIQYNDCTGYQEYLNIFGSYIFNDISFYTCNFTLIYNDLESLKF